MPPSTVITLAEIGLKATTTIRDTLTIARRMVRITCEHCSPVDNCELTVNPPLKNVEMPLPPLQTAAVQGGSKQAEGCTNLG